MTPDEFNLAALAACSFPAGDPQDPGGAVIFSSPFGLVVETPCGVFELRDVSGRPVPVRRFRGPIAVKR